MKYDEIIKALERMSEEDAEGFSSDVLNLVEIQQVEIESLNKEVDRLSQCVLYHDGQIADAIKDFAEKLKAEYSKPDLLLEQDIIVIEECALNEIVKKWKW